MVSYPFPRFAAAAAVWFVAQASTLEKDVKESVGADLPSLTSSMQVASGGALLRREERMRRPSPVVAAGGDHSGAVRVEADGKASSESEDPIADELPRLDPEEESLQAGSPGDFSSETSSGALASFLEEDEKLELQETGHNSAMEDGTEYETQQSGHSHGDPEGTEDDEEEDGNGEAEDEGNEREAAAKESSQVKGSDGSVKMKDNDATEKDESSADAAELAQKSDEPPFVDPEEVKRLREEVARLRADNDRMRAQLVESDRLLASQSSPAKEDAAAHGKDEIVMPSQPLQAVAAENGPPKREGDKEDQANRASQKTQSRQENSDSRPGSAKVDPHRVPPPSKDTNHGNVPAQGSPRALSGRDLGSADHRKDNSPNVKGYSKKQRSSDTAEADQGHARADSVGSSDQMDKGIGSDARAISIDRQQHDDTQDTRNADPNDRSARSEQGNSDYSESREHVQTDRDRSATHSADARRKTSSDDAPAGTNSEPSEVGDPTLGSADEKRSSRGSAMSGASKEFENDISKSEEQNDEKNANDGHSKHGKDSAVSGKATQGQDDQGKSVESSLLKLNGSSIISSGSGAPPKIGSKQGASPKPAAYQHEAPPHKAGNTITSAKNGASPEQDKGEAKAAPIGGKHQDKKNEDSPNGENHQGEHKDSTQQQPAEAHEQSREETNGKNKNVEREKGNVQKHPATKSERSSETAKKGGDKDAEAVVNKGASNGKDASEGDHKGQSQNEKYQNSDDRPTKNEKAEGADGKVPSSGNDDKGDERRQDQVPKDGKDIAPKVRDVSEEAVNKQNHAKDNKKAKKDVPSASKAGSIAGKESLVMDGEASISAPSVDEAFGGPPDSPA